MVRKWKNPFTEPLTSTEAFQPICCEISSMLITLQKYLASLIPPPTFHHLLPCLLLKSAEVWCNWIQLVQKFQPEYCTRMDQISGSWPKAETVAKYFLFYVRPCSTCLCPGTVQYLAMLQVMFLFKTNFLLWNIHWKWYLLDGFQ